MNYWLMKSEPDVFGWSDLKNSENMTVSWEGVRNYQARNYLREMKEGDLAFFYHSRVKPQVVAGIMEIVKEAYPDPTQFDSQNDYYDPKSQKDDPRWVMVDVRARKEFDESISRDQLKKIKDLKNMVLLNNTRLSVQPVTQKEWEIITSLGTLKNLKR